MSLEINTTLENFIEVNYNLNGHQVANLLVFDSVALANAAIAQADRREGYPILIALPVPVFYAYIGGVADAYLKPVKGYLSTVMQVATDVGSVATSVLRDEGLGITGLERVGVGLYNYTGGFIPDAQTIVVSYNNEASVYFQSGLADIEIQKFDDVSLSNAPSDLGFAAGGLIEIRKYL